MSSSTWNAPLSSRAYIYNVYITMYACLSGMIIPIVWRRKTTNLTRDAARHVSTTSHRFVLIYIKHFGK